jgi:hypothetical protein
MILGNVICNLRGVSKIMFLRHISDKYKREQVLQISMVLPTFAKTKVGPAAG